MAAKQLEAMLAPYNPWWQAGTDWQRELPDYRRPVVAEVAADLRDLPQMMP